MRLALFLLLLLPFAVLTAADCKSYINGSNGFPLGIMPLQPNVTVVQDTSEAVNTSFKVYIEGDAVGGNLAGCTVKLSIQDVLGEGARLYVAPQSLDTGLGWKDAEAFLVTQPAEPYGDVNATIKIMDADNAGNYALLPVFVRTAYRPTPTPAPPTPEPTATAIPSPSASPTSSASKTLDDIGGILEEDASKYFVALIALFFLGALLWVGFKTLQRD